MKSLKTILLSACLALAAVSLPTEQAEAQTRKELVKVVSKDTAINADTVYVNWNATSPGIKRVQVEVKKISGTVAGIVTLQGRLFGEWESISDTLTLANATLAGTKQWDVSGKKFYDLRVVHKTSGTQRSLLTAAYLKEY